MGRGRILVPLLALWLFFSALSLLAFTLYYYYFPSRESIEYWVLLLVDWVLLGVESLVFLAYARAVGVLVSIAVMASIVVMHGNFLLVSALLDALRSARERIGVAMYVVKRGRFVDELIKALRDSPAGTKVVVLESHDRGEFLSSNKEVVEYLRRYGVDARLAPGRNVQHLKLVVVDDWVVIGSHNWTDRALTSNDEVSIAVRDRAIADMAFEDIKRVYRGERIGGIEIS